MTNISHAQWEPNENPMEKIRESAASNRNALISLEGSLTWGVINIAPRKRAASPIPNNSPIISASIPSPCSHTDQNGKNQSLANALME